MDTGNARAPLWLAALLLLIAALAVADLALDGPRRGTDPHLWVELVFLALCLGSAAWLARAWVRAEGSLARVQAALRQREGERDAWRRRAETALAGLGAAIDEQLGRWQLTPAEKDTALLLLKGLSHKEIAQVSGRSERTVRQHAIAVYRKSGLAGRAELSAYFLDDLMLPAEREARPAGASRTPA